MSANLESDTTAKNWYLVAICDDEKNELGKFFWGIVVDDRKRRFQPGHYVCSTLIEKELSESQFKTKNSVYEGVGKGASVSLNIRDFELLKSGFSPDEIEGIKALKESSEWRK